MKIPVRQHHKQGVALITLLIFVLITTTITTASIVLMIANAQNAHKLEQGTNARSIAESGAENALLRLIRDPAYTGETLNVANGTAVIVVTGTDPKTITVTGTDGNFVKKIQVIASYTDYVLTVISWREIFQ